MQSLEELEETKIYYWANEGAKKKIEAKRRVHHKWLLTQDKKKYVRTRREDAA